MAAKTYKEMIAIDLRILVGEKKLTRWSNADDIKDSEGALRSEDTTWTAAVASKAAAWVRSYFAVSDNYDDGDATIGDQAALDYGVRRALFLATQIYSVSLTDSGNVFIEGLNEEIAREKKTRVRSAASPVHLAPDPITDAE